MGTKLFAPALKKAYARIPSISVDYGIMERTKRVEVLAAGFEWDDLGSWDAVARHRRADAKGNRVHGDVTLVFNTGLLDIERGCCIIVKQWP